MIPADLRRQLEQLIAKWRENAEALYRASRSPNETVAAEACMVEGAGTLQMCADELAAALAAYQLEVAPNARPAAESHTP